MRGDSLTFARHSPPIKTNPGHVLARTHVIPVLGMRPAKDRPPA
jgi:hypothetical protein